MCNMLQNEVIFSLTFSFIQRFISEDARLT